MSEGPKTETLLDAERLREDFPILRVGSDGKRLCYIDNAATTQNPGRSSKHWFVFMNKPMPTFTGAFTD